MTIIESSPEIPVFANSKNETLSLLEIMKKNIVSVTIAYLSEERKAKADGFKGILGLKKNVQDEKEVTITDPNGISFYFAKGVESATIRFSEKREFEKLVDYDEDTLWKRYMMTIIKPYQIHFHIGNLKKIDWIEEN